jgi:disulfide bond formation protein DsbB
MGFLLSSTATLVNILSFLTLVGDVMAVALLVLALFWPRSKASVWIGKRGLVPMLLLALMAMGGSLFLSEIAGWVPCKLCWLQRIFMYPQVILLGVAAFRRDRKIAPYILALCLVGMIFSTVHYLEQAKAAWFPSNLPLACDASGISCAATQVQFEFGYITIPMMALTVFVLNALGSVFVIRESRRNADQK